MTFAAVEQQFLNIQKNLPGLISPPITLFDPDVHALFLQELDEVNQQISVLQMQVDEMDTATKDFFTQNRNVSRTNRNTPWKSNPYKCKRSNHCTQRNRPVLSERSVQLVR